MRLLRKYEVGVPRARARKREPRKEFIAIVYIWSPARAGGPPSFNGSPKTEVDHGGPPDLHSPRPVRGGLIW